MNFRTSILAFALSSSLLFAGDEKAQDLLRLAQCEVIAEGKHDPNASLKPLSTALALVAVHERYGRVSEAYRELWRQFHSFQYRPVPAELIQAFTRHRLQHGIQFPSKDVWTERPIHIYAPGANRGYFATTFLDRLEVRNASDGNLRYSHSFPEFANPEAPPRTAKDSKDLIVELGWRKDIHSVFSPDRPEPFLSSTISFFDPGMDILDKKLVTVLNGDALLLMGEERDHEIDRPSVVQLYDRDGQILNDQYGIPTDQSIKVGESADGSVLTFLYRDKIEARRSSDLGVIFSKNIREVLEAGQDDIEAFIAGPRGESFLLHGESGLIALNSEGDVVNREDMLYAIEKVTLSDDGKRVAYFGKRNDWKNQRLEIRNSDLRLIKTIPFKEFHRNTILSFSADSQHLIVETRRYVRDSDEAAIRTYSAETGNLLAKIPDTSFFEHSPDGTYLLVGQNKLPRRSHDSEQISIFDYSGKQLHVLKTPNPNATEKVEPKQFYFPYDGNQIFVHDTQNNEVQTWTWGFE